MHLRPEAQLQVKRDLVLEALSAEGLAAPGELTVEPSPAGDVDFRHVVKLGVARGQRGTIQLGGFARGTREILPIPKCLVVTDTLRGCMTSIAYQLNQLDMGPYDEPGGLLRYIVMRQSRTTGRVQVVLVAGKRHVRLFDLAKALQSANGAIAGVHLHVNNTRTNVLYDADEEGLVRTKLLSGQPHLEEEMHGIRYVLGPADFFQTNPSVAAEIVQGMLEMTAEDAERPALDLYCGIGALTLPLARQHGFSLGVERAAGAILRARQSAGLNNLDAEFLNATSREGLAAAKKRLGKAAPVVVVDPARRGLEDHMVEGICALNPARVIYVSCNPRALARDLADFAQRGYTLDRLRAFDMFPQTAHVEVMARLSPKEAPEAGRAPRRRIVR